MNELLAKANISIRTNRPLDDPSKVISVFRRGNFLQLTFQTQGCRYSNVGSCSMCNYGKGTMHSPKTVLQELECICRSQDFLETEMVLLGASGSFLDKEELPEKLQYDIMKRISQSHMKEIFIETHCNSFSELTLQKIRKIFSEQCVHIEMGLETITAEFQTNILNKIISLENLKYIIDKIHTYHMFVDLNVLFGMPFLTIGQQIEDTRKTINWALENGADDIIIFPINIQPYTVFEWWYARKYITVPSLWGLFALLLNLNDKELMHICLAWYGNRSIFYSQNKKTIIPYSCSECRESLISFYEDFTLNRNLHYRKKRLQEFLYRSFSCNCRQSVLKMMENNTDNTIAPEWFSAHKGLERWLNEYAVD